MQRNKFYKDEEPGVETVITSGSRQVAYTALWDLSHYCSYQVIMKTVYNNLPKSTQL